MNQNIRLLAVLLVGIFMAALDIAIVGPAIDPILHDFHISHRLVTWMFTIYILFNLIGTPFMARMSDLFGRRRVYVTDVLLFCGGSLLVAVAPWFWMALLGRAIQGFGSGGIFPVAAATIGDIYPPEKRGGPLGLMGMVLGIAFIVGPIVAGVILLLNWRWLFFINLPIGLAIAFFALRFLPARKSPRKVKFDWPGMAVIGIMLWSLAFGANRIDTAHFVSSLLSREILPFFILPFLFLPFLIYREEKASWPVISPSMFRTGQLKLSYGLSFGSGYIQASMIFLPALISEVLGTSSSSASFLLLPVVLSLAVFAPVFGRLLGKIGPRAVIGIGTVILTAGFFLLSLFMRHGGLFIMALILIGVGLAVLFGAPLRYVMLNEAEEKDRTTVQALGNLFSGTGQIISSALIGAIVASAGGGAPGYRHVYETAGLVAFALFLVSLGLRKRRTARGKAADRPQ